MSTHGLKKRKSDVRAVTMCEVRGSGEEEEADKDLDDGAEAGELREVRLHGVPALLRSLRWAGQVRSGQVRSAGREART